MKRDVLVFSVAFLLGFFLWGATEKESSVTETSAEVTEKKRTSSSRKDDAVKDYENVILTVEEKFHLEVEQANTLSTLLGLVEQLPLKDGYFSYDLGPAAEKLSKLYPIEALRYYAERPSNFKMNERMWGMIVRYWAARDLTACLNYLEHGQTMSMDEFCSVWEEIVKKEWDEKSAEIVVNFSQMSAEKQNAIFQREQIYKNMLFTLRPKLRDPLAQSMIEPKQDDRLENHVEGRDIFENIINVNEMASNRRDAMVQDIIDRKLTPMEIESVLRDVKLRDDRQSILHEVLQKRDTDGTIEGWLERVKETMAVVSDIPDHPPGWRTKGDNSAYEALEIWLPKQSAKIQRAWADDLVNQMYGEDAMQWIDTLSQASLRADLRDEFLESWVRKSPSEAAEYVAEKATVIEQEDYLPTAVYRWALQDYAAAKQWIEAQADSPAKAAALKKLEPGNQ
jgi:hypothetical protein